MTGYLTFVRQEARWLMFGLLMALVSSMGQTYFISLFGQEIRLSLNLSHSAFAAYYSIGTITGGFALFWAGPLIDRVRLHLFAGFSMLGLLLAGAMLAMSWSGWMLLPAIFLLRFCGQGLCTHIAMTSVSRWFAQNRGKAISIAQLGLPIGEAILPGIVVLMLAVLGWRESWWWFVIILALVFIPLALMLVWSGERVPRSHVTQGRVAGPSWTRSAMVRDPRFWLMLPAVTAPAWIFTGIFFHQVPIVQAKGWGFAAFAIAYIGYAAAKVASGLIVGILVDRWRAARIAPWAMPLMSLAILMLILIDHALGAWVFLILLGIHVGLHMTAVGALWAELYGTEHLGAIKALVASLGVISSALGPPVFGLVLDSPAPIDGLLWFCIAYGLISAVMIQGAMRIDQVSSAPSG